MNEIVSVIMPVYNIEKIKRKFYKAVNSVLNSTYKEIELIIVNDGSTDNTSKILNNLNNKSILVLNKNNGGVESARRYGLKNCNGNYIFHMDQDDYIKKETIEMFVNRIKNDRSDVVVGNAARFFLSPKFNKVIYSDSLKEDKVITNEEFMKYYYIYFFGINDFPVQIWNKLYSKSFLDKIPDPPLTGLINEDLNYNLNVLPYAKKISVVKEVTYLYRWGGYTNKYDPSIFATAISCFNIKMDKIKEYNLNRLKKYIAIELINYLNSYIYMELSNNKTTRKEYSIIFNRIVNTVEYKKAVKILKKNNEYHNDVFDSLVDCNENENYILINNLIISNRHKNFIKKILIKYFGRFF